MGMKAVIPNIYIKVKSVIIKITSLDLFLHLAFDLNVTIFSSPKEVVSESVLQSK